VKNIDQNKLYKMKHPETRKYSNAQVILVNGNNFNKKIVLYLKASANIVKTKLNFCIYISFAESLKELSNMIQSKRTVVKPIKHLASLSDSFSSSAEETLAKSKNVSLFHVSASVRGSIDL